MANLIKKIEITLENGRYLVNGKNTKNWISIEEKMPEEGEQVLVVGFLRTELTPREKEQSVGLVIWGSAEKSYCSDSCYYGLEYQDITHWQPIDAVPSYENNFNKKINEK